MQWKIGMLACKSVIFCQSLVNMYQIRIMLDNMKKKSSICMLKSSDLFSPKQCWSHQYGIALVQIFFGVH
jgi:hypothetical protein